MLSVVTLTWDGLELTKKFVESIRKNTSVSHELIMVDNGSSDGTQDFIKKNADKYHFFDQNTGFAHGFNKGMALASGEYIAICNNDTEFPKNWFEKLSETFSADPKSGLVYPCYTKGMKIAERWWPGRKIIKLPPFNKECPSGVAIFSKLSILKDELSGFSEDYEIAGGEDLDLCFKTWAAGLNIYIDQRVLVKHKSKGTAGSKLPNWKELYTKNGQRFQEKWKDYLR
ncbi:MAG: glycosyltransferase family 2 protein [Candidatus Margulisiibacteriota bacterium]|nr:glycosyltransferase family 2 protein [Candidatus Margulisiibacteriota bacterium]